jgi:hypothetical protein
MLVAAVEATTLSLLLVVLGQEMLDYWVAACIAYPRPTSHFAPGGCGQHVEMVVHAVAVEATAVLMLEY